jgi:hypothetical protein
MNGCELHSDLGQLAAGPFASIPAGVDASDYLKWYDRAYRPIGGGALESNILGLWFAKQTAKGSAVTFTSGTKRGRWVGGDLQTTRADGTEAWSDQTLFGDAVDFVNTLTGTGAPVIQGQSSLVAYLSYLACGQETVTGGTNAVITLTETGSPTGGTFTLSWVIQGTTYTTAAIAYNAAASAIATAIQSALPIWPAGVVTGGGGPLGTSAVTLTFSGALGNQPIPLPTVTASLTGGTTPAITPTSSTVGVPYTHVATPADTGGFWFGIFKSVGKSVVARHQYNDCRMQSLRIEGSSASKVVKVTPTILSLDPGVYQTSNPDPTKTDDGLRPFIYTEAHGQLVIDGVVYSGQSAFAVVFNWGLNEYYGDDVVPYDLINNVATVSLEGLTLLIDAAGIQRYNSQIYGTPTPTAGQKPIHSLPLNGSYQATFTRTNPMTGLTSESLYIEIFGVKWEPTLNIPGNPAGGPVELSFTGAMRKTVGGAYLGQTGLPPFRITTMNYLDPAFTS